MEGERDTGGKLKPQILASGPQLGLCPPLE